MSGREDGRAGESRGASVDRRVSSITEGRGRCKCEWGKYWMAREGGRAGGSILELKEAGRAGAEHLEAKGVW